MNVAMRPAGTWSLIHFTQLSNGLLWLLIPVPSLCRDASTVGLIKVRRTYPFGVDSKWHGSRSELPFLNSLKMKMSILLGVAQMNLGIVLSYFNAKYFGSNINIWYVILALNTRMQICKHHSANKTFVWQWVKIQANWSIFDSPFWIVHVVNHWSPLLSRGMWEWLWNG